MNDEEDFLEGLSLEEFYKQHPDKVLNLSDVVRRKVAWDSLPCDAVPHFLERLGLVPGTEEGNEIEHLSSHERLDALLPIYPVLLMLMTYVGEAIARVMLDISGFEEASVHGEEAVQIQQVVEAGSLAVLANLLDMGMITLSGCEMVIL